VHGATGDACNKVLMIGGNACSHFIREMQVPHRRRNLAVPKLTLQLAERIAQSKIGQVFQPVAGKKCRKRCGWMVWPSFSPPREAGTARRRR